MSHPQLLRVLPARGRAIPGRQLVIPLQVHGPQVRIIRGR